MKALVQPGTILVDKYRLESLLGRGGIGSVWRLVRSECRRGFDG